MVKIRKGRKKVGLALGSGGARGYAHIGIINVLQENNIPIDFISGSSIGSLVGAYYALNLEVKGIEKRGLSLKRGDLLKLVDLNDPRISLVKGEKVKAFLKEIFQDKTFADTKIPLRIAATDLQDGSLVTFDSGSIVEAVMASGAFPGVFPVVNNKGRHLIDGGLADGVPIEMVRKLGADVVIGVDLNAFEGFNPESYNVKEVLERTFQLLVSKLSVYKEKDYGNNVIILKPKTGPGFETFSFDKAEKNIKAGVIEALENISRIRELVR